MNESINNLLNIPEIQSDVNFWMVRAKRGFFFDEYLRKEFIAIGWNSIKEITLSGGLSKEQKGLLKEAIKDEYGEKNPGAAVNKCIRFYSEIKVDDIAMIVDRHRVAFATIGDYYEEDNCNFTVENEIETHEKIESAYIGMDSFECPYIKRRKIKLLRYISEESAINPYLFKAMAVNRHSLSDLNEYAETILSGCFDSFIYKNKLTVTFRVNQKNDINALTLADFVSSSARLISNNIPEMVTVKTTLHSPGDVILQVVNFAKDNMFPLLLLYIAVFGGKAGDYELNSLLGILKSLVNRHYDSEKKNLELRKLKAETELVEQQVEKQKLDMLEKQKQMQLQMINSYAEPLIDTSAKLDLDSKKATIIDITKIINFTASDGK